MSDPKEMGNAALLVVALNQIIETRTVESAIYRQVDERDLSRDLIDLVRITCGVASDAYDDALALFA